jgi:hypothetical protein
MADLLPPNDSACDGDATGLAIGEKTQYAVRGRLCCKGVVDDP